jgi:hypothetical protein
MVSLSFSVSDTVLVGVVTKLVQKTVEFVQRIASTIFKVSILTVNLFSLPPTVIFNSSTFNTVAF